MHQHINLKFSDFILKLPAFTSFTANNIVLDKATVTIDTCNSGVDPVGAHPARTSPKIWKNMIFWRKIVTFHTKYPNYFRASLHSAQFFLCTPP